MPERVIRIHAAAAPKPPLGGACNGCGLCCLAEPCPLGRLISGKREGECRGLRWNEDARHYRCGPAQWPGVIGALARRWIAAGHGCDSDAEVAS